MMSPVARLIAVAAVLVIAATARSDAQSAQTLAGMNAYNAGDVASAYRLLNDAANAGDPEAQVNLGYLYARGQGVTADQKQAFDLYAQSAEQGNSEGMNALGYKYQYATGVPKDMHKAIAWYCQAVAYGNARAMNNLAIVLDQGRDLPHDEQEARSLWKQSAELNHFNAMYNLGISYLQGNGAGIDPAEGVHWMQRAARNGLALAQTWLRQNGDTEPFPSPINWSAMMVPTVRHAGGHTRVCSTPVS
jgi:TPR repeat protein